MPYEEHMLWVSPDFAALAKEVHELVGAPVITLDNCWNVFKCMSDVMEADST